MQSVIGKSSQYVPQNLSFCVLLKKKVKEVLNDIRVCNNIILVGELFLESNLTKLFLLSGILGFVFKGVSKLHAVSSPHICFGVARLNCFTFSQAEEEMSAFP